MIIITTVGRAGSSMLARYCQELGLDIGSTNYVPYYKAGYECQQVAQINNMLRRKDLMGESLKDKDVRKRIKGLSNDVAKDPQFLVHPVFIEQWWFARKDIKVIYLWRTAKDIVSSQRQVPKMNSPVFRNHADLIVKHGKEFVDIMKKNKIPHKVFRFPNFLDKFDDIYNTIVKFHGKKIDKKKAKAIWEKLINKTLIHNHGI